MGSYEKEFQEYLKANSITIYKAEKALEMSNGSLGKAFERGSSFKTSLIDKIRKEYPKFKEEKRAVPVYNVDFTAGDITQFQDAGEKILGYVDFDGFRECVGFVRVKGSSMYPDFVAGDYIGLEPEKDLKIIEYGQPYGIVTKSGKRMIKIIRLGKDDDNLILRSVNKEFDDIRIHKADIMELFKVHGPLRDQWQ